MLAQSVGRGVGLRHVTPKFLHIMAPMFCPCGFQARGLAENMRLGSGARPGLIENFRAKWFL